MKKQTLLLMIFLPLFSTFMYSQTQVDGFYLKKGELSLALSYTSSSYKDFYAGKTLTDGNPAGFGEVSSSIFSLYGTYGINNWLSAIATLPYIAIENESGALDPVLNVNQIDGLQDVSIFLKAKLLEHKQKNDNTFSLGIAGGVNLPIGDYDPRGVLSIGNQATAIDGIGIVQYNANFGLFTEFEIGYSIRNNSTFNIPNAVLSSLKLGYFNDYFYAHAKIGIQNSQSGLDIGTAEFGAAGGPAILPETNNNYTNLDLTLCIPVYENFNVSLSYLEILEGRNFGNNSAYSIGFIYKKQ